MLKKNLPVWDQKLLEGELRALRKTILRRGTKKLGPPSAEVEAILLEIEDNERLDRVVDAIDIAESWVDLLATS